MKTIKNIFWGISILLTLGVMAVWELMGVDFDPKSYEDEV